MAQEIGDSRVYGGIHNSIAVQASLCMVSLGSDQNKIFIAAYLVAMLLDYDVS